MLLVVHLEASGMCITLYLPTRFDISTFTYGLNQPGEGQSVKLNHALFFFPCMLSITVLTCELNVSCNTGNQSVTAIYSIEDHLISVKIVLSDIFIMTVIKLWCILNVCNVRHL